MFDFLFKRSARKPSEAHAMLAKQAALATASGAARRAEQAARALATAGDEAAAGKKLGKDAGAGKATFVSLLGEERARQQAATAFGDDPEIE